MIDNILPGFYLTRHSSPNLYTVELIGALVVFFLCLILWKRQDRASLGVYFFTGLGHSIVEMVIEGLNVRVVEESLLFGLIPLKYPFVCFILGYFEGGIFCLIAYYIARAISKKDRIARNLGVYGGFLVLILGMINGIGTQQQISSNPDAFLLTRRLFFTTNAVILYMIFLCVALIYCFLVQKRYPEIFKGLGAYYWGLVWATFVFIFPAHVFGVRYIEIFDGEVFISAPFFDQIWIMYGLQLFIDGTCTLIHYYPIIGFYLYSPTTKLN